MGEDDRIGRHPLFPYIRFMTKIDRPHKRFLKGLTKATPVAMPVPADDPLYEEDFVAWIERQVALLRAGRIDALDRANLAEELEDMGKSRRLELRSRLEVLLTRLLKYEFQPQMRTGSWRGTIFEQRLRIGDLIDESPSLKPYLGNLHGDPRLFRNAAGKASLETGIPQRDFPAENPYGPRALEADFWPGPGPHPGED